MPRPKPEHGRPGITFRASQPVIDELDETTVASAEALGRKFTRTELMQTRNEYARRHMPLGWKPDDEPAPAEPVEQ